MDLKEAEILADSEASHWYYQIKSAMLLKQLEHIQPQSIIDIGAGTGYFSKYLLDHTKIQSALCVDPGYSVENDILASGKPIQFRRHFNYSDADLVLLMDVLEHIDDDTGFLLDLTKKTKPGAWFLITAPAFQFLWSSHDVFLEHRRRYRLSDLEALVSSAGLKLVHGCYFYALLLPMVALTRWTERIFNPNMKIHQSHLKNHHPLTNKILNQVCRLELDWHFHNRVAGLTVVCLARKL